MAKIVSKRGRDDSPKHEEVDFELQLISDEELDAIIERQKDDDGQQEFEYYHEEWVIQGRQAFEGLRMVKNTQAMEQDWDCCYNPHIQTFNVRTPGALVMLTIEFVQSLSMPIKQYLLDYNAS